jgi:formate--tetrahydrofolate ligase
MKSDIEIAQARSLKQILQKSLKLNLTSDDLIPYSHYIAKFSAACIQKLQAQANGQLILVMAISPTPAGRIKRPPQSSWQMR